MKRVLLKLHQLRSLFSFFFWNINKVRTIHAIDLAEEIDLEGLHSGINVFRLDFWYAHHLWSRRFGLDDPVSIFLSLLLIFVVLIFVYPLKAVFSGAFNFIPGIDSRDVFALVSVNDFSGLLVVFGLAFSSLSAIIAALNWHALRLTEEIGLSKHEKFDLITSIQLWLVNTVIPLCSALIALLASGVFWAKFASFFYIAFALVTPLVQFRRRTMRKLIE